MKTGLFTFFCFISTVCFSQETQWASKVLGFSSERTGISAGPEFRSAQILGKPAFINSNGEECQCAWSPASSDAPGDEWIKVGFANPMKINRIVIAENFNAGSIARVLVYDAADKETIAYNAQPSPNKDNGRLLNVVFNADFEVVAVKIIVLSGKVPGYNQIDAIGITTSKVEIAPKINLIKDLPKDIVRENLGSQINSELGELAPIVSADGRTLYFTRENSEQKNKKKHIIYQKIFVSNLLSDNNWTLSRNLGEAVNLNNYNSATSVSGDNKSLYVINVLNPDGTFSKGLSKSIKTGSNWNKPKEIKIQDYYNLDEFSEFSMSADEQTLILGVERKISFGKKDLYVSFKLADGTFSKPLNMGDKINTVKDEGMPFLAADNKTLYFTSYGLLGYGDGDIFISRRLDSTWTNWSEPENLGMPINSSKWDGYFSISAAGDYAYFSSSENSLVKEEIFRIKTPLSMRPNPVVIVSGTVVDGITKKPIAAEIIAETFNIKDGSNTKIVANYDPATGEYKLILPIKQLFQLSAKLSGFLAVSESIDLSKDTKYREIRKNLSLVPIQKGTNLTLNNLVFLQGESKILENSYPELYRLVSLLKEYPTIEILLEGHTDNQGDMLENIKLSQERVDNVSKFLFVAGIDKNRITTKAWGGSKPVANNMTDDTRKKNRRVEFTITKI